MADLYGYAGKVLRIDLTEKRTRVAELDRGMAARFLGGRGFNSKRLYDEVETGSRPLGPENRLLRRGAGDDQTIHWRGYPLPL